MELIGIVYCLIVLFGMIYGIRWIADRNRRNHIKGKRKEKPSEKKYTQYYGDLVPYDEDFEQQVNTIYSLITEKQETDINKIAREAKCSVPECVLKIRHLKNNNKLEGYYIDTRCLRVVLCSKEDEALLNKYQYLVLRGHLQIKEIANQIVNPKKLTRKDLQKEIKEELLYLEKKGLLGNIKINEIDGKIIYDTDKHNKEFDYETVHCPNCGALIDVDAYDKVSCSYCHTIVEGSRYDDSTQ